MKRDTTNMNLYEKNGNILYILNVLKKYSDVDHMLSVAEIQRKIKELYDVVDNELIELLLLRGASSIELLPDGKIMHSIPSDCTEYIDEVMKKHSAKELFDLLSYEESAELFFYCYSGKLFVMSLSEMDELC